VRGYEGAQDSYRLGGDDSKQPCTGDALVQCGLILLNGKGGEDGVGQTYPENDSQYP